MTIVPAHVTVHDEMVRELRAVCRHCGARAWFGRYPDRPDRAGQLLTEWLERHQHDPKGPPK